MSIDSIRRVLEGIDSKTAQSEQAGIKPLGQGNNGSFGEVLNQAIESIEGMQQDVHAKIEGVITGGKGVVPHEAMITLEKADIAFQLMNQVRGKIVRAYEEIMRTTV